MHADGRDKHDGSDDDMWCALANDVGGEMQFFRLELDKSFSSHKQYKVYRHTGRYLGLLTVWNDGYVGYSADGDRSNLSWMREVAETYKKQGRMCG